MHHRPTIVRRAPGLIDATARMAVVSGSALLLRELSRRRPGGHPTSHSSLGTDLEDLCRMKREGFLTELEFSAAKARLLDLS